MFGSPGVGLARSVLFLGVVPLLAALYYMIGKGENWARIIFSTYCIVVPITPVAELWSDLQPQGELRMSRVSLALAEMSVDLVALLLLFRPASSAWFRAMSGLGANPLESIFSALRNTDQPMLSYAFHAWLIGYFPFRAFEIIVKVVFKIEDTIEPITDSPVWFFLGPGLIGPWGGDCPPHVATPPGIERSCAH